VPEPTDDEQVQQNYRKMVAAGPQGQEAVQQVMLEISPGEHWAEAASNLIQAWEEIRPRMMWDDPEFGGTICFPPTERPLRKLLNAARAQEARPDPDGTA
jgi:hypothetical protein